jgi:hypothetical protein
MPATPIIRNKQKGLNIKPAAQYTVTWKEQGCDSAYLYQIVYEWLADNGWHNRDDENFPEIAYIDRDFGPGGKEIWAYWRLTKQFNAAPKDYVIKHLDINFHFLNIKPHEIVYKGKKIKTQKGEFELDVSAYLVFQDEKYWSKLSIIKGFQKLMSERIMKKKKEKWRDELRLEAHRLREMLNIYLKLPQYYPEKEVGEFWLKRTGE